MTFNFYLLNDKFFCDKLNVNTLLVYADDIPFGQWYKNKQQVLIGFIFFNENINTLKIYPWSVTIVTKLLQYPFWLVVLVPNFAVSPTDSREPMQWIPDKTECRHQSKWFPKNEQILIIYHPNHNSGDTI